MNHENNTESAKIHQKNINEKTVVAVTKKEITVGHNQLTYLDIRDNVNHFSTENPIVLTIGVMIVYTKNTLNPLNNNKLLGI